MALHMTNRLRILFAGLILAVALVAGLALVHSATAHAQARTATTQTVQTIPSYSGSWGFVAWWGFGAYISHADVQHIGTYSDAFGLAQYLLGNKYGNGVGTLAYAIWGYLWYIRTFVDHGNGVYVAYPWAGAGPYIWSA